MKGTLFLIVGVAVLMIATPIFTYGMGLLKFMSPVIPFIVAITLALYLWKMR